jgi:hypothetical protein
LFFGVVGKEEIEMVLRVSEKGRETVKLTLSPLIPGFKTS